VKGLKKAALPLLLAHACALWSGVSLAGPVTRYRALYTFEHHPLYESVPAAVAGLIKAMEAMNGTDCSSSLPDVPPEQATTRKCTYLDHETNGVHFRMKQVVDSRNGAEVIHSENTLGGTYQTYGPWLITREHPRPARGDMCLGHPIHPISGRKTLREELRVGSVGGQSLVAQYDTQAQGPEGQAASIGGRWSSSLHRRLATQADGGNAMRAVQVQRGDGNWQGFTLDGAGTYQPDSDVLDRLQPISGGWRYTDASALAQETYDTEGRLLGTVYADGRTLSYAYSGQLLVSVQDQAGRSLQFAYDPAEGSAARLRQVTGPAGTTTLAHDAAGNLSQITDPDGRTRQYLYERSDLPWAVTGIVDEGDKRLATYGYDNDGLAIETQWAGGADHYSASYAQPPVRTQTETFDVTANILWRDIYWLPPVGLNVTAPNGAVSEISTTVINNKVYLTGQSQPAGAGCAASTRSQAFDANGILSRRDDFNGTRSCYANDLQRKLPLTSVEGLNATQDCIGMTQPTSLPTGARMTSTEWHPDWPLPVREARPGVLTTSVYNGQRDPFAGNQVASCAPSAATLPDGKPLPLLCKQVAQATLDANGVKGLQLDGTPAIPADPNGTDPGYAGVSLLLHLDGGAWVDSSANAYPVTPYGHAAITAAAARYGAGGLSVDGSAGTYATVPAPAMDLGGSDFTVEGWVRLNAFGNFATLISNYGNSGARGFEILTGSDGNIFARWSLNGSSDADSLGHQDKLALGVWSHFALVRQGNELRIYLNGVPGSRTATINGAIYTSSTPVNLGRTPDNGSGVWHANASLDDIRITKGAARYTQAFSPPTGLPGKPLTPAVPSWFNTAVANRVSTWTYNERGQVLTAKGTRSSDTTTYTYHAATDANHTVGDLATMTDAAGKTTTYDKYDKLGQLLQSTDPDGVVTLRTYDARQRLLTSTVGTETTTYTYDPVGQLTQVTQPDGRWIGYEYDDAHRQTAVKDSRGNRIDYQLDNAGKQIGQTVKDPGGSLRRDMARVMDALGRVQQGTGRE